MTPKRRRRLASMGFIFCGTAMAVALLLSALGSNMHHYYDLSAIKADDSGNSGHSLIGKTIRVGGVVEIGSIKRRAHSLDVRFVLTNFEARINVSYTGILPDLFSEGQGVLAKGKLLDKDHLVATEILAKHDENYMPKAVREALEKSGYDQHAQPQKQPQEQLQNTDQCTEASCSRALK